MIRTRYHAGAANRVSAWAISHARWIRTDAPTIGSMSTDRPRHHAFWRFTGVDVDGGGFDGFGACARTFMSKSVSHCARMANAYCFAPGNVGVDVIVT